MAQIIPADSAVKLFKGVSVQTAERVRVKGDDGKVRESFKVNDAALKPEHVLKAEQHDDHVVIVTIDGKRHRAPGAVKIKDGANTGDTN